MDAALLIDSIVRQTTVLVAQLATYSGTRAPLAHTTDQVFLSLVSELKHQGLGNKVISEMFGLALRTYHGKLRRLSDGATGRGKSLWTVVLEFVQANESVTRGELLQRFQSEDPAVVKSVLRDLVGYGFLFFAGRGQSTVYRTAHRKDTDTEKDAEAERLAHFVWVAVRGSGPQTVDEIAWQVSTETSLVTSTLARLVDEGKVTTDRRCGVSRYRSVNVGIPEGSEAGWQAAVFDHFQALVSTICAKLVVGSAPPKRDEEFGASTYYYDVWPGHPCFAEVKGYLSALRQQSIHLRERVEAHNQSHPKPSDDDIQRFVAYVGQSLCVTEKELV